jgi:hypothetical protein
MKEDRRKGRRRGIDHVLGKTVELLQILQRLSGGEDVDYSEPYADLVGMKNRVGRREEDHKLGETLCSAIGGIAANIAQLRQRDAAPRKVRITKVSGKEGAQVDIRATVVGWEEGRPAPGRGYRVFKDDGGVFSSAPVTKVTPGHFQTQNSLYRIEVLEGS